MNSESINNGIFERVKVILMKHLHLEKNQITNQSRIKDDLGADSLDIAEIALMIREEFEYDLSEQEIKGIVTVQNICDFLTKATLDRKA